MFCFFFVFFTQLCNFYFSFFVWPISCSTQQGIALERAKKASKRAVRVNFNGLLMCYRCSCVAPNDRANCAVWFSGKCVRWRMPHKLSKTRRLHCCCSVFTLAAHLHHSLLLWNSISSSNPCHVVYFISRIK